MYIIITRNNICADLFNAVIAAAIIDMYSENVVNLVKFARDISLKFYKTLIKCNYF